jgi:acyl-CoA reductase-like NAD-dependent aldehyde dehydrogenase
MCVARFAATRLYSSPVDKDIDVGRTAPEEKHYIGGHWLEGREWYEVQDKVSGGVLASVPICDDELFEMAVAAVRDSAPSTSALPPEERAKRLRAWADALDSATEELTPVLHRESAVPLAWAGLEIEQAALVLRRAAVESERSTAETVSLPAGTGGSSASVDFAVSHPVGPVAALLPERHALYYAAKATAAALATGCPVLLLATPLAPLAVQRFVELGSRLSWPAGSLNLIFGTNGDLGLKLAADPRIVLLVLAGTVRDCEALVAGRGGRPLLTLGSGFGCAILDRSADVAQTVTTLLGRRFRAPLLGRAMPYFILVPQSLTSRLNESLAASLASLSGSDLREPTALVPWQISDGLAQRAEDWLTGATQAGGVLVCGGERRGAWVGPSLLVAPAGFRPLSAPPPEAPFFVVDSYDKQFGRHLARFPDLREAAVFSGDIQSALELAQVPNVSRIDVFTTRPGRSAATGAAGDADEMRRVMSGMMRRKWVELHLAG